MGGKVGIGTTSPLSKFDIYGNGVLTNLQEQSDNTGVELDFTRHTDLAQRQFLGIAPTLASPNEDIILGSTSGMWNSVSLQTGGGRLFLNSSGNVGIGTTAPSAKLTLATASTSSTSNIFEIQNTSGSGGYSSRSFTVSSSSTHVFNELFTQGNLYRGSVLDIADILQAGAVRKNFAPQTDTMGNNTVSVPYDYNWYNVSYPSVITWTTSTQVSPRNVSETVGQLTSNSGDGSGADYRTALTSVSTGISDLRGVTITFSFWAKTASGSSTINLALGRYADNDQGSNSCAINSTAWTRCVLTRTFNAVSYTDNSELRVYTSGYVTGTTYYVFGAQVEQATNATAYQKNSASAQGSGNGLWAGTLQIGNTMQAPNLLGNSAGLTVANSAASPTTNIFEVTNTTGNAFYNGYTAKYLTVSSTATLINPTSISGYKVGIGTATPTDGLQIVGAPTAGGLTVGGASESLARAINLQNASGLATFGIANSASQYLTGTSPGDLSIGPKNANSIFFGNAGETGNTVYMTIKNTGNIGIGTSAPISQLHVPGKVPTVKTGALTSGNNIVGLVVQGRYAYVASNGDDTFRIFDVSNPSSPTALASLSTGGSTGPDGVFVQGKYAYLTQISNSTLRIIDISHPTAPVSVSTLSLSGVDQIYVQGRYAFITDQGGNALKVVDVASSTAPVEVGSVSFGSGLRSVFVQGKYAYVASSGDNTLHVIDVSNPAAPAHVGSVSTGSLPFSVYVQGRYAYVANLNGNSVQIVDVATSTAPTVVSTFTASVSGPRSIRVEDRYAYFLNQGNNTLQVVDVSNPSSPTNVGTVSIGSSPRSLFVSGRYAYAGFDAGTGNMFEVYDVGGAYLQQLETGGIEAGTIHVRDAFDALDGNFIGGLGVGNNAVIGGNFSVSGQSALMNRVGIGTAAPSRLLDVQGFFELNIDGTTDNTVGVCKDVSDTTGTEADVHFNDCNGTPGDIAEWYPVSGSPTAGYIVETTTETMAFQSDMMDPKTGMNIHRKQDHVVSVLRKSSTPYSANILGVVSTSPVSSFGMGVNDASSSTAPIALIGRVPTKVVTENGPIAVGDPITTSSTPGVGMKATKPGRIVGIALNAWDGSGIGEIEVFTNPGWYNGPTPASGVSVLGSRLTVENDAIMDYQRSTITNVAAIISSSGLWSVTEDGYLIAQHIEAKQVKAEEFVVKQTDESQATGEGVVPANTVGMRVENNLLRPNSRIFVSFLGDPGAGYWIGERAEGSFILHLGAAPPNDLAFEYWILNVEDLRVPTGPPSAGPAASPPEDPPDEPIDAPVQTDAPTDGPTPVVEPGTPTDQPAPTADPAE